MLKLFISLLAIHFAASQTCSQTYTIRSGDTCWLIWNSCTLTESQFYAANPGIDCNNLRIGQVVCIGTIIYPATTTSPVQINQYPFTSCSSAHVVRYGDSCLSITQQYNLSPQQFLNLNPYINCNNIPVGSLVCIELFITTTLAPTTTTVVQQICKTAFTVQPGDSCDMYVRFRMVADYQTLYAYNPGIDCNNLRAGQVICAELLGVAPTVAPTFAPTVAPTFAPTVAPTFAPTAAPTCSRYHRVVAGDTCWAISNYYKVTEQSLYAYNYNLNCGNLQIGQIICMENSAINYNYNCARLYTVKSGDTCWAIANCYSFTTNDLLALNSGLNCATLQVGQVISIGRYC